MRAVGNALNRAGLRAVYLVHGTFAGTDLTGILTELGRWLPSVRESLNQWTKQLVDSLTGDHGNFTAEYAELFQQSIYSPDRPRIPVRLFNWSSENHHLGRADGAVRLLHRLATLPEEDGPVLLWGHSHAGNVFALLTNLLAGDAESRERFFAAARSFYRVPVLGITDLPHWPQVCQWLENGAARRTNRPLDIVTFGTPIRYGWDTAGYRQLLHFVNHHPRPGTPEYLTTFPPAADDVLGARGGDYIQQIGIAGSNTMPHLLFWRAWLADRRLHALLEPDLKRRRYVQRLATCQRVPAEGTTLLVDYPRAAEHVARHMAGHAVYTRRDWLLFHAEEVAARFYEAGGPHAEAQRPQREGE